MVKNHTVKEGVKVKQSFGERVVEVCIYIFVTLVALLMLYPVLNVLAVSLSDYHEYVKAPWLVIPRKFTLDAYDYVAKNQMFWRSYLNSFFIVAVGTAIGLAITILVAYPISRPELKGKGFFVGIMIVTMVFTPGMIPEFINIRNLGLYNTIWAVILPGTFSAFNCILMINFFREIPASLIDAAKIDGAGEPYILWNIVVKLSSPVIATITLYLAVGYWNNYFNAQIYLEKRELWPISLTLKEILMEASVAIMQAEGDAALLDMSKLNTTTLQYACVVASMIPMMIIYPFLQKYFAKGILLGGVKG